MTRAPTVGDRMAVEPIVIRVDASLTAAAEIMDRVRVSGLPVVDNSGTLVGVLSQADLARARSTEHLWANWPGLGVRHLMTTPAVTVTPSTPLVQAVRRMERLRIHRLIVVAADDPLIPIGVLSLTDVVHEIAEHLATDAARPQPDAVRPQPDAARPQPDEAAPGGGPSHA